MADEAADVIVVGHGLAGLVVTSQIVEVGKSVLLIDKQGPSDFGGSSSGAPEATTASVGSAFSWRTDAALNCGFDSFPLLVAKWFFRFWWRNREPYGCAVLGDAAVGFHAQ